MPETCHQGAALGVGTFSNSAAVLPRRQVTTAVAEPTQPAPVANVRPVDSASATGRDARPQGALWTTARAKSPRDPGAVRWAQTLRPPADRPPAVTFAGFPPNAAAFARVQRSAACWSMRP
ncbi:hypothetical protein GCM10020221_10580 [Streptomyces thioluteus]|uniref:Uncharacterized protein n=1 Tax=Streptomyces thioluteus TaxID=66431 RepID=A0ABN3WIE3_STRTU